MPCLYKPIMCICGVSDATNLPSWQLTGVDKPYAMFIHAIYVHLPSANAHRTMPYATIMPPWRITGKSSHVVAWQMPTQQIPTTCRHSAVMALTGHSEQCHSPL